MPTGIYANTIEQRHRLVHAQIENKNRATIDYYLLKQFRLPHSPLHPPIACSSRTRPATHLNPHHMRPMRVDGGATQAGCMRPMRAVGLPSIPRCMRPMRVAGFPLETPWHETHACHGILLQPADMRPMRIHRASVMGEARFDANRSSFQAGSSLYTSGVQISSIINKFRKA